MVFCKELNREYTTKEEMYKALKANKVLITDKKKSTIKYTDYIDLGIISKDSAVKAEGEDRSLKIGDYVYPVINTTNYFDSHGDVHIDDIWNVSVIEQKGKVYYIINHDLEVGKVIAYPEEVELMLKTMNWTDLGRPYPGQTQALIFKVRLTEDGNTDAIKAILAGRKLQNSVRMRYIRIKLCINDGSPYYVEEYANWLKYIDKVANRDDAEAAGYFWAVLEAGIYKEGSAVLFGSNDVTPILHEDEIKNDNDPPAGSQNKDKQQNPSADSLALKKSIIHQLM